MCQLYPISVFNRHKMVLMLCNCPQGGLVQRKPRKPESSLAEVSFAADCGGSDDSLLLNRALQEGLQLCALLAGAADVTGPGPVAWRLR